MKEFNHRCAVCGADRPHLHHIDENPANNEVENLIPLCPNHHLIDQHDATNAIPQAKLRFFRKHKHRNILKPQFNSVFRRISFLYDIGDAGEIDVLYSNVTVLSDLVKNLAMGEFYAGELQKLLKPPQGIAMWAIGSDSDRRRAEYHRERAQKYRDQLRGALPTVERLIVEMLDYQNWA